MYGPSPSARERRSGDPRGNRFTLPSGRRDDGVLERVQEVEGGLCYSPLPPKASPRLQGGDSRRRNVGMRVAYQRLIAVAAMAAGTAGMWASDGPADFPLWTVSLGIWIMAGWHLLQDVPSAARLAIQAMEPTPWPSGGRRSPRVACSPSSSRRRWRCGRRSRPAIVWCPRPTR